MKRNHIFIAILIVGMTFVAIYPPEWKPSSVAQSHSAQLIPDYTDMILIPSGEFVMGSSIEETEKISEEYGKRGDFVNYNFEKEQPKRIVNINAFYIDKYEVTNAQYKKFIDATGHTPPRHWNNNNFPPDKEKNPVINVTWSDAHAYALWAGKRLPTEEEWEKAARGTDGRIYPWGSEFRPDFAGTAEGILYIYLSPRELFHFAAPVIEFRGDKSPYGVYDMAGNVMEWTDSWFERGRTRVVKGASWVHLGVRARSATLEGINPDGLSHLLGFRCAVDINQVNKSGNLQSAL